MTKAVWRWTTRAWSVEESLSCVGVETSGGKLSFPPHLLSFLHHYLSDVSCPALIHTLLSQRINNTIEKALNSGEDLQLGNYLLWAWWMRQQFTKSKSWLEKSLTSPSRSSHVNNWITPVYVRERQMTANTGVKLLPVRSWEVRAYGERHMRREQSSAHADKTF